MTNTNGNTSVHSECTSLSYEQIPVCPNIQNCFCPTHSVMELSSVISAQLVNFIDIGFSLVIQVSLKLLEKIKIGVTDILL